MTQTEAINRIASTKPELWPLVVVNGENFLTVPEWFVMGAVDLAKSSSECTNTCS